MPPPYTQPIQDFPAVTFITRDLDNRIRRVEEQLEQGKFVATEPFRLEINAMKEDIAEINSLVKGTIKLVVGQLVAFVSGVAVGIVMWVINTGSTP